MKLLLARLPDRLDSKHPPQEGCAGLAYEEGSIMKSKEEVRDALGLDELPDDEFMRLLEEVGEEETVTGVSPVEGEGYTPEAIRGELRDALVAKSVGDLIASARSQAGSSLRRAGEAVGVSHSRIQQLEASENLEVSTLVRVAAGLGFRVKISLEPDQAHASEYRPVVVDLTESAEAG